MRLRGCKHVIGNDQLVSENGRRREETDKCRRSDGNGNMCKTCVDLVGITASAAWIIYIKNVQIEKFVTAKLGMGTS